VLRSPRRQWRRRPIPNPRHKYSLADWGQWLSANALSFGALCWILLWVGINTGPWNLQLEIIETSWIGFSNGIRAALPLIVLAAWAFHLLLRRRAALRSFTLPETFWLYYGLVMLIASIYVDPWFDYAYWGFAYLSAFAATEMYMQESSSTPEQACELNRLNWLLASLVLVILVWAARGQLLAETSIGVSGYGVLSRMPTVAGMPMVRASGISRLAAVPAIVVFPLLWQTYSFRRLFWAALFIPSVYLVWVMQSRGSLVSFAFAFSFMMILLGGIVRRAGIGLAVLLVTVFMLGFIPGETVHHLYLYATRGAQGGQLESMSGRTQIFAEAWKLIKEAPFIGYGPQADRRVLTTVGNAQNGALYALLCAGFLGGFGYIAGLLVSSLMLFRIARVRDALAPVDRIAFIQVAGIMAFFTMRSYPENCAALFSVDLLLQLPAMVYLGELDRHMRATAPVRRIVSSRHVQSA
jgi:O-antigen ligase